MPSRPLRFITYLAPGLPLSLFEALAAHVEARLGTAVMLQAETRFSGPVPGEGDPFSTGEADLGFLCAPPFLRLCRITPPPVELLPAAPVFRDPLAQGRPVYFSHLIVRASQAGSLQDLHGATWAYNDPCSLSGYLSLLDRIARLAPPHRFFDRIVGSGSHLESIRMVVAGEADAAAIDSNVLRLRLRAVPELAGSIRVVETLGPHPIQPVVVRRTLDDRIKAALAAALLAAGSDSTSREALDAHDIERFVPVSEDLYRGEWQALCGDGAAAA